MHHHTRASETRPGETPAQTACPALKRPPAAKIGVIFAPLAAIAVLAWTLASCTTTITPQASLSDPVGVLVVDHGRTTSLVIPASGGNALRYAYGDWDWYALGKHSVWYGTKALLWPTQGALGRELLDGTATIEDVRHQVPESEEILCVPVERARLLAFATKMQALFDAARGSAVPNPDVGMTFVRHPKAYTVFRNSNHAVESWLRELGSTTRGLSFGANWRVTTPQQTTLRCGAPADA